MPLKMKYPSTQLAHQYYVRHFIMQDVPMGDEQDYNVNVDFQNYYDAAWFGAPIVYPDCNVPSSEPFLTDSNKYDFLKQKPNVWNDFMKRNVHYGEYMAEKCQNMTYRGKKVNLNGISMFGTDGAMTVACNIRGTTEFCIDLYEDKEYALNLLDYINEALIERILALREKYSVPTMEGFWFADDSIALLQIKIIKNTYSQDISGWLKQHLYLPNLDLFIYAGMLSVILKQFMMN